MTVIPSFSDAPSAGGSGSILKFLDTTYLPLVYIGFGTVNALWWVLGLGVARDVFRTMSSFGGLLGGVDLFASHFPPRNIAAGWAGALMAAQAACWAAATFPALAAAVGVQPDRRTLHLFGAVNNLVGSYAFATIFGPTGESGMYFWTAHNAALGIAHLMLAR